MNDETALAQNPWGRALIDGMHGLGDTIYLKAFVRSATEAFHHTWLRTPWPQLFSDLPREKLTLLNKPTSLRTQDLNQRRQRHAYSNVPPGGVLTRIHLTYHPDNLAGSSIVGELQRVAPWSWGKPLSWELPPSLPPADLPKRYAVVRPATLRREFPAPGRNPDPHYIQLAIDMLKQRNFHVISVADIAVREEWFDGPEPRRVDTRQHHGEGGLDRLMQLVRHASVCVGGVGWLAPMAMAMDTPTFVIGGGVGAHNAIDVITDPRMLRSVIGWARPEPYCMCADRAHDCNKEIDGFEFKLSNFLDWVDQRGVA